MLRERYSEKFYSCNTKYINNRLALRPPQGESLERFAKIVDTLSLSKEPDLAGELVKIRELFPTLAGFEREFPSVCFALATGIGKTRLLGAFIAYLVYEKGFGNFFVMAPNLTIYNKLKVDLGSTASPKYVFRGLDKFVSPPRIIDGGNYEEFRQSAFFDEGVTINVFNIGKLNSESGRMRRLNEVLGQSYFAYLQSLPDLCVFMDESHHYHADRGFDTINELRPVLGVELTATPQIQVGAKKVLFKNVVYEYSLANALNDGLYVKVPTVFTRHDFHPEEYAPAQLDRKKLIDGIRLHEEIKSRLEVYARANGKPVVKPFVLVVAKDTAHSAEIREYLTSDGFFRGYYKDKALEVNSAQRGAEKDANIELLLSLERPGNNIEIVIHVNMLKEGWDVANLYTIIPLRASASETLTEQTIGRGLRLPYGQRTGVEEIDRLSIVSHDRYEAIVSLANSPDSLVRKVRYIEEGESGVGGEGERETVELPSKYDFLTSGSELTEQLALTLRETATPLFTESQTREQTAALAGQIQNIAAKKTMEVSRHVRAFSDVSDIRARQIVHSDVVNEVIRRNPGLGIKKEDIDGTVAAALEICARTLTENVIPIPRTSVQPYTAVKRGFHDFKLDTGAMAWHPSDDTLVGTELKKDGKTFDMKADAAAGNEVDTAENEIARHIAAQDNVDYAICSDLIYALISEAKEHFLSYLNPEETEKVMRDRRNSIVEIIYNQMNEHFYKEEVGYQAGNMYPFTQIEPCFGAKFKADEICDLRANVKASEVKAKVFSGFRKAGHTLYKFDSDSERMFAIVLENDVGVLKWLRPAPKQFNIYWGAGGERRYEPDFIVETAEAVYMCEPKAKRDMGDKEVLEKAAAGREYCRAAGEYNARNGGKPWVYALIPHDEIHLQSSFGYLVKAASAHWK